MDPDSAIVSAIAFAGPIIALAAIGANPGSEPSVEAEIGCQVSTRAVRLMQRADPELRRRVFCSVVERAWP